MGRKECLVASRQQYSLSLSSPRWTIQWSGYGLSICFIKRSRSFHHTVSDHTYFEMQKSNIQELLSLLCIGVTKDLSPPLQLILLIIAILVPSYLEFIVAFNCTNLIEVICCFPQFVVLNCQHRYPDTQGLVHGIRDLHSRTYWPGIPKRSAAWTMMISD